MTEHPLGYVPEHDHTEAPDAPVGVPGLPLSIDDILSMAKRVERTAHICLRSDLIAEHEDLVRELASLVTPQGELIEDPEAAVGEKTARARAEEINDRLNEVNREMRSALWSVRFRAMDSDAWAVFCKKYMPKDDDMADFNSRLIVECAIEPQLTLADVAKLRKALSPNQMKNLAETAFTCCTQGGLDVPKLSSSLRGLTQQ